MKITAGNVCILVPMANVRTRCILKTATMCAVYGNDVRTEKIKKGLRTTRMTLQEFEAQGGCEGCHFYGTIDVDGRKGCAFCWFDDESEDWEHSKNCDEISD